MYDRREKGFTVAGIDGNDRMSSIGRPEHDELGAAIGLPTEEAARNAMLRHWAVIGLDAAPAVGKRNNVEPVLDQRADGSGGGREQTCRCGHKTFLPRAYSIANLRRISSARISFSWTLSGSSRRMNSTTECSGAGIVSTLGASLGVKPVLASTSSTEVSRYTAASRACPSASNSNRPSSVTGHCGPPPRWPSSFVGCPSRVRWPRLVMKSQSSTRRNRRWPLASSGDRWAVVQRVMWAASQDRLQPPPPPGNFNLMCG